MSTVPSNNPSTIIGHAKVVSVEKGGYVIFYWQQNTGRNFTAAKLSSAGALDVPVPSSTKAYSSSLQNHSTTTIAAGGAGGVLICWLP